MTSTMSTKSTSPLVLVVLLSATFVQLLNASIVYIAVANIQSSLHATSSQVQFVLVGYQLGFACMLITGARLGDIFGRKRLFLIGMVTFTVISILCSFAPTIEVLILARILQGVTSGLMFPQVLSFIQVLYTGKDRAAALGSYGAAIGLGSILGPTIGGALIQANLGADPWRAIFFVNVPIGVAATIAAARLLKESTAPDRPRLDIIGALLSAAGLGLVLFALGTIADSSNYALTIAEFIAGLALLAVFVFYQRARTRANRFPVLDTGLFRYRNFSIGMLMSLVFYAGVPAFFLIFSLYLLEGQGFGPLLAGLATIPYAVGTIFASINADTVAARIGKAVLALGAVVLVAGMLILLLTALLVGSGSIGFWVIPGLLLGGLGFGLFIPPLTDFVLDRLPAEKAGQASGTLTSIQQVGGAIGVTLISIVFFGTLASQSENPAGYTAALVAGLVFEAVVFVIAALLVLALPNARPQVLEENAA